MKAPHWQDDEDFSMSRHLHHVELPAPGGDAELQADVDSHLGRPLPHDRPLWEVHVVGVAGGSAIYSRFHHALADGIASTSSRPGSTFECTVDGSGPVPCSSPKVLGPLTDGPHDFAVSATDPAGNSSGFIARTFTVDTISPDPVIDSGPPAFTKDPTPTFTFSADEPVTFACRVDGDPFGACTEAGAHTTAALSDGLHSFRLLGSRSGREHRARREHLHRRYDAARHDN